MLAVSPGSRRTRVPGRFGKGEGHGAKTAERRHFPPADAQANRGGGRRRVDGTDPYEHQYAGGRAGIGSVRARLSGVPVRGGLWRGGGPWFWVCGDNPRGG